MNTDSNTPRAVIGSIIALGIVILALGLFFATPSPAATIVLTGLLSALTLALGQVIQFYFGSSAGSKVLVSQQNDTVKTLANAVANSAPVPNADTLKPSGTPGDPVSVTEVKPPQWAVDPKLEEFKTQMKKLNPNIGDDKIEAAYNAMNVDVHLP